MLFWRWLGGCGDVEAGRRFFWGGLGLVRQYNNESRRMLRLTAVRLMIWVFVYVNWEQQYDLVALMCD